MKRILVPLDGSVLAEAALAPAARIAGAMGADLLLFHVIEASPPGQVHGERHLATAGEARAYLEAAAGRLRGTDADVSVSTHVHEQQSQDAARSIGEHAEELRSDLVVLATHGAHRFGRFLKGSVAQRAFFFGGAPVLTIPASENAVLASWTRMTVTVDASGEHPLPLEWLGGLARGLGLSVELLLVVDTRSSLRGDRATIARSLPGATSWALEAAALAGETWLSSLAASPEFAGLEVGVDLLRGAPDKALAARVAKRQGDLVVIGTHGRAGIGAMWEGSMAAKMLARLEGAVLLIPAANDRSQG
jgi:nucleotide-binding universal stress UspA family protein